MSDASLSKTPEVAGWGIPAALFLGFCAYLAPQLSAIAVAPLIATAMLTENLQNFVLLLIVEALTVACVLLLVYSYGNKIKTLGFDKPQLKYVGLALIALGIYFVATIVTQVVVNLIFAVPDQPQDLGFSESTSFEKLFIFIALVILAPLAEETLFRGFIFTGIRKRLPFWLTALIVSGLFALVHGQLNVGLDVFVLSLGLCFLRERTQSLWPGILLHAFKNAIAFVLVFVLGVSG